jgi:hypothetical protein
MAQCTAPVRGHSSSAAAAACPACRYRYGRGYGYGGGYSSPSYPTYLPTGSGGASRPGSGGSPGGTSRPRWSRDGSAVFYTSAQVQSLTPIRDAVEKVAVQQPDLRDCFLCHAWPDRQGAAKDLDDALKAVGVKTWFSELDLGLGIPMMRAIDRGLANSRIGLVLVTPNFIKGLPNQGVADKELSALLAGNRLVPIVHGTTYDELRNVSPLLASRTGLDTKEDTMADVAAKIAELVKVSV